MTLRRSKPLKPGNGRLKRGAFVPRKPMKATRPKVTPKVTPEERAARKVVRQRSQGACEVCGRTGATNMHHRRKAGRVWTPENLIAVCGWGNASGCHGHIERNPAASREQGWIVPSHRDPARVPAWLAGRGYVFLHPSGHVEEAPEEAA